MLPACKALIERRYRRNCFNAAQYGSAVRRRARHASPRLVQKVPSGFFAKLLSKLQNQILQHDFAILPLRRVI